MRTRMRRSRSLPIVIIIITIMIMVARLMMVTTSYFAVPVSLFNRSYMGDDHQRNPNNNSKIILLGNYDTDAVNKTPTLHRARMRLHCCSKTRMVEQKITGSTGLVGTGRTRVLETRRGKGSISNVVLGGVC